MPSAKAPHLYPSFPVLAQALEQHFPGTQVWDSGSQTVYRGVRRYTGQALRRDMIYIISAADAQGFPLGEYAFVTADGIGGRASHIYCPGASEWAILEVLQELFAQLQEIENRIVGLSYENGGLRELCDLAEELLGNPVCIHDSWFMILARSRSTGAFMPLSSESWESMPQHFLDEFRMDAEYLQTYHKRGVQLWESILGGRTLHTLYVNLYDKEIFRGRFLVTDTLGPFRPCDGMICQLLAGQALLMMKQKTRDDVSAHRSTDDILSDILNGKYVAASEFSAFLRLLDWEKGHRFLCVRLQRQEDAGADPGDHVLHRELLRVFDGSYILFAGLEQCVLINLTRTPMSSAEIRHLLAPLCRDHYQYGGISSPVEGIRELPIAFHQAREALDRAFRLRDDRWIVRFHDCALEYVLTHLNTPMQLRHLVAPQLLELLEQDREKGSQLFQTLQVYLDNERDIPKTAEKLIIHRTTLTYRLKKIASIMDLDLEDADVRLYLRLSLRMLEREKTVKLPAYEDRSRFH